MRAVVLPNMHSRNWPDAMTTERFTTDDKLVLTNLKKVFWPAEGYTKGDLIEYTSHR